MVRGAGRSGEEQGNSGRAHVAAFFDATLSMPHVHTPALPSRSSGYHPAMAVCACLRGTSSRVQFLDLTCEIEPRRPSQGACQNAFLESIANRRIIEPPLLPVVRYRRTVARKRIVMPCSLSCRADPIRPSLRTCRSLLVRACARSPYSRIRVAERECDTSSDRPHCGSNA